MNKIVACGLLLVGLFSLTGCFEKEIKTVEYFKTHPEEMEKKIDECKKAKSMTDTDRKECENAAIAKEMKKWEPVLVMIFLMINQQNKIKKNNLQKGKNI